MISNATQFVSHDWLAAFVFQYGNFACMARQGLLREGLKLVQQEQLPEYAVLS